MPIRVPQKLRFLLAGGTGVLLYYAVLYMLTDLAGAWYVASAVTASIVNFAWNFKFHRKWTFQSRGAGKVYRQMILYGPLFAGTVVANAAMLYALVELVYPNPYLAQVPVSLVITVANWYASRRIFTD